MRWGGAAAEANAAGCSWAAARCGAGDCRSPLRADAAVATSGKVTDAQGTAERLPSPSPARAEGSECGLTASGPALSDVGVQTEDDTQGATNGADSGRSLADFRGLNKEEVRMRKHLANLCGCELTLLLASALRQEVAARAAGDAAARTEQARARAEAATQSVALQEAVHERDAALGKVCAATAAQHAAQRRHASASLRVEQLEAHSAQVQLRFQSLAEEHAVALREADSRNAELLAAVAARDATRAQLSALAHQHSAALEQDKAEREAREAARESGWQAAVAGLRLELQASAAQCGFYEQQLGRLRELQGIGAVEAAGREALGLRLCDALQQLRAKYAERGCILANEASSRGQLRVTFKYTGPAAEHDRAMPVNQALMVNTICHGVAVYAPEKWAPVCSSTALASLAVMRVHHLGWKAGEATLGAFRSRGVASPFDEQHYGPEPGPLHSAWLEVDRLTRDVINTANVAGAEAWKDWHGRWITHLDIQANIYAEARLRHHRLLLTCWCLTEKAARAAARIEAALTMYAERTEAEGGDE